MTRKDSAVFVVVSLMLALIVRAALEALFQPVFVLHETWGAIRLQSWLQSFLFFIVLLRFYLGTMRHASAEPSELPFFVTALNFVFAFLVFCTFYLLAQSVTRPDLYYWLLIFLHVVDTFWFVLGLFLSFAFYVPEERLKAGEVLLRAARRVMAIFLALSLATLGSAYVIYVRVYGQSPGEKTITGADYAFMVAIFGFSVIDLAVLRNYYFSFEKWVARNSKT
jgi:hypothetical protein